MHRECIPLDREEYYELKKSAATEWICINCSESLFPFNHLHDEEQFQSELSKYYNDLSKFHNDVNNETVFNVFDLNDNELFPLFPVTLI